MPRLIDLVGKRFGRLTVLERVSSNSCGFATWLCLCDCGEKITSSGNHLRGGDTQSCGCLRKEIITKHGGWVGNVRATEYTAYHEAKARCTNPNIRRWKDYGGRGIQFKFTSFKEFLDHIGPKPTPKHSLDRINNDGNYELGNIRWATNKEQNNNKRLRKRLDQFTDEELQAEQFKRMPNDGWWGLC